MQTTIESFGEKFKVSYSFSETAYLPKYPRDGQVVRFAGPNGPVNRTISLLPPQGSAKAYLLDYTGIKRGDAPNKKALGVLSYDDTLCIEDIEMLVRREFPRANSVQAFRADGGWLFSGSL